MGAVEKRLAKARGVQLVVEATADRVAAKARSLLAAHWETGAAHITVDHSGIDSEITLVDPGGGALAIEYGRGAYTRKDGHHIGAMEGLHVLGRAVRS